MLMQLGPFQFRTLAPAPHTLSRSFEYRWQPVERVSRRPAMQYMGPGVESLDIAVTMYPHVTGGMRELEGMRRAGQMGTPYRLVTAAGFHFGLWCITSVSDEQTYLDRKGNPRKVDFTLSIKAYGGDAFGLGSFLF